MKNDFKNYLIKNGYKEYTPSGHPSTVFQYIKSIDFVCDIEYRSWIMLASNIDFYINLYDVGGEKEYLGMTSHRTIINALKRFKEFLDEHDNTTYQKNNQKPLSLHDNRIKHVNIGSTITYKDISSNEINKVKIVECVDKNNESHISKNSELGAALLYCKEGDIINVDCLEPYSIQIIHITNPLYTRASSEQKTKTLRELFNEIEDK